MLNRFTTSRQDLNVIQPDSPDQLSRIPIDHLGVTG
jgi:hypothetical protein